MNAFAQAEKRGLMHRPELTRDAAVGRLGGVREVDAVLVDVVPQHDVLQQRVRLDGAPDLRLLGRVQVDRLGVAATLEIKYPVIVPPAGTFQRW